MAIDIETATLEEYRNMMLRPTKLNEIAQVLYDLAQQGDGSIINIESNTSKIEDIENALVSIEEVINDLDSRIVNVVNRIDIIEMNIDNISDALTRLASAYENLDERVSALENA